MTIESTIKEILANITEGVENASDVKLRKMPTLIYDKESTLNKIGRTSAIATALFSAVGAWYIGYCIAEILQSKL